MRLVRFGVSLDKNLLGMFDRAVREGKYTNRSEAIRDLIRERLVKKEWRGYAVVAGVITIVYDHHKRELVNTLLEIQHSFQHLIISTQHIHVNHDNCLETIVVKGKPKEIEDLSSRLKSAKGVKHGTLTMATTGKGLA